MRPLIDYDFQIESNESDEDEVFEPDDYDSNSSEDFD